MHHGLWKEKTRKTRQRGDGYQSYSTVSFSLSWIKFRGHHGGVHETHPVQAYKPCVIRTIPSQTFRDVWWWRPPMLNSMGLQWNCSNDKIYKLGENEPHGPLWRPLGKEIKVWQIKVAQDLWNAIPLTFKKKSI